MAVKLAMRVLGFMTGTSLDAIDMAVLDTDAERIIGFGPAAERKLDPCFRAQVEVAITAARTWPVGAAAPALFESVAARATQEHLAAAMGFFSEAGLTTADLDLVGVHGQTILHEARTPERRIGRSVQLIDAPALARALGIPVAHDFRAVDIAAGGHGAPLAPVYHRALVGWSKLPRPLAVLNLGGVGNVTFVGVDGELTAFDTGPANGMIDLLVQARTPLRCDVDGALAAAGRIDEAVLASYLRHPYFAARGPKSLDRLAFSLDPVAHLTTQDGAATLTAFAAEAVARGLRAHQLPLRAVIVTGGGRRNPTLMEAIRTRVPMPVKAAETVGWRGDSIEAKAFAFLAARTRVGLPSSYPTTTGVAAPLAAGRIVLP